MENYDRITTEKLKKKLKVLTTPLNAELIWVPNIMHDGMVGVRITFNKKIQFDATIDIEEGVIVPFFLDVLDGEQHFLIDQIIYDIDSMMPILFAGAIALKNTTIADLFLAVINTVLGIDETDNALDLASLKVTTLDEYTSEEFKEGEQTNG